jgi:WD40 repeat protein
LIATGGVRFWDSRTGKLRRSLKVPRSDSVAFSSDGKILATGIDYDSVRLWEVSTGREKKIKIGDAGDVSAVAFSPDGKTLATGGSDKIVKLWDTRTGQIKRTLTGHDYEVNCVAFSPEGGKVASGSSDRTVRVWGVRSGKLLVTFMILPASQQGAALTDWIAFTPEGYYTVSPGGARFIRWRVGDKLFSAETYERVFHRPDLVQKTLQSEH